MNQVPVLDAVKRMKDYELLHCAFRAKGAVGDKKKIKAGREEGGEEIPHMPKTMRGAAEDKKEAEGSMPADWSVDQLVSPSFFFQVKYRLRLVRPVSPAAKHFRPIDNTLLKVSAESRESGWRWSHQVRLS